MSMPIKNVRYSVDATMRFTVSLPGWRLVSSVCLPTTKNNLCAPSISQFAVKKSDNEMVSLFDSWSAVPQGVLHAGLSIESPGSKPLWCHFEA